MSKIKFKCNVNNSSNIYEFKILLFRNNIRIGEVQTDSTEVTCIDCLNPRSDYIIIMPESEDLSPECIKLYPKALNCCYLLNFEATDTLPIQVYVTDSNYANLPIEKGTLTWLSNTQ